LTIIIDANGVAMKSVWVLLLWFWGAAAQAGDRAGDFSFYVLSLSWSPEFCRDAPRGEAEQCGSTRRFGFVVHGLWPQHADGGWPQFCEPADWVPEPLLRAQLDLMPSRRLVLHQWRKHGSCSGLKPAGYFQKVRAARESIVIPPAFVRPQTALRMSPAAIAQAFVASNPTLPRDALGIVCSGNARLTEVRVCVDQSLAPTACGRAVRACRAESLLIEPLR
jgi:ribonuclease T2